MNFARPKLLEAAYVIFIVAMNQSVHPSTEFSNNDRGMQNTNTGSGTQNNNFGGTQYNIVGGTFIHAGIEGYFGPES